MTETRTTDFEPDRTAMTTAAAAGMTEAIDFYQVDSFTSVRFRGAPAGVCVLAPGSGWPKVRSFP